jgi:hypothetical protein
MISGTVLLFRSRVPLGIALRHYRVQTREPTPMSNNPTPGERGRSSSRRRTATVLRLLRGEDLELVSRERGVTAATLCGWRDDFLAGGQAALESRPADDRDDEVVPPRARVGGLTVTRSPRFVREPEGDGAAERFLRTLKENLLPVRHFATVAGLTEALREFRRRSNEQRLVERRGVRKPSQAGPDSTTAGSIAEPTCRRVG